MTLDPLQTKEGYMDPEEDNIDGFNTETEESLEDRDPATYYSVVDGRAQIQSNMAEIGGQQNQANAASSNVLAAANAQALWVNPGGPNPSEVVEADSESSDGDEDDGGGGDGGGGDGGGGGNNPPQPGDGAPNPITLDDIHARLVEIQNENRAANEATQEAREQAMRQKAGEHHVNYGILAFAGAGFFFALIAYLIDKLSKKKAAPISDTHHDAKMAMSSDPLDAWYAMLPSTYRQMVDGLLAGYQALGEQQIFANMSNLAKRHPVHLNPWEHIRLLQDVRVIGSPRDQSWIWNASEKLGIVKSLAQTVTQQGFPAFYTQLATMQSSKGVLPVTVAANCGQYAIVLAFGFNQ